MKGSRVCQIYFTNIAELVVVVIIAGLISNTACFDCFYNFHQDQLINGVVFGFLIVCALIVINICVSCDLSPCWSFIVACLGAILFFIVAILLLVFVAGFPKSAYHVTYFRLLVAGLLSLFLTVIFAINAYLIVKSEECRCACECC